jgi:lysozyme
MRQISAYGLQKIQEWEGMRLHPYQDGAGVWTDGYGNTHGVTPHGPPITQEKASADLLNNLASAERCVSANVAVPLTDNQFAALVSFVFNVGCGSFEASTLLRYLNDDAYDEVPAQLMRWNKITVNGVRQVSNGLNRRRGLECALWEDP